MKHFASLLFLALLTITGQAQINAFHDHFASFPVRHYKYLHNETLNFPLTELSSGQTSDLRKVMSKLADKPSLLVCFNLAQTGEFGITQIDSLISLHKDNYNLILLSLDEYNEEKEPLFLNHTPEANSFGTIKDLKKYIYEQKSGWIKYPFYYTDFTTFNNLLSYGISYAYLIMDAQKRPFHFVPITTVDQYLHAREITGYMQDYLPSNKFTNDTIFYNGYLRSAKKTNADEYMIAKSNKTRDTTQYRFYSAQNDGLTCYLSLDTYSNTLNGPIVFYDDKKKKVVEGALIRNGFAYLKKWDDKGILRFDMKGVGSIIGMNTLNNTEALAAARKFDIPDIKYPEVTTYDEQGKKTIYYRFSNSEPVIVLEKEEWRPDGTLKEAIKDGITYTYHPNGKPATVISYDNNGKKNGIYKRYSPEGALLSLGNYINDKRDGQFEEYTNEGKPLLIAEYVLDKRNGKYQQYYKNGKPQEIGYYINGDPHGKNTTYYENGSKKKEENFENGKNTGLNTEYYENGKTKKRSFTTNNDEQLEYYYENGTLFWKTNGRKSSSRDEEPIYYADGKKWAVIRFTGDKASCSRSEFYDRNGNIINHKSDFSKAALNMLNDPQVASIFDIKTSASGNNLVDSLSRSYKENFENLFLIYLSITRGLRCN